MNPFTCLMVEVEGGTVEVISNAAANWHSSAIVHLSVFLPTDHTFCGGYGCPCMRSMLLIGAARLFVWLPLTTNLYFTCIYAFLTSASDPYCCVWWEIVSKGCYIGDC